MGAGLGTLLAATATGRSSGDVRDEEELASWEVVDAALFRRRSQPWQVWCACTAPPLRLLPMLAMLPMLAGSL